MNRLKSNPTRSGVLILALLLTVVLASCGGDDPVEPAETNRAPAAPDIDTAAGAPADGATDVGLAAQLHWTCTDPDSDPLTYAVQFGTAAAPPVVAEDQAAASYAPAALEHGTTYYWKITASDDGGKSTGSPVWSFTTIAANVETVGAPATPIGPATGEAGGSLAYTGSGAVSSDGHAVEYRFDWGDGTMSAWGSGQDVTHAWTASGTYNVRAQARCAADTDVESPWSSTLSVGIAVAEVVTRPSTLTGDTPVETAVSGSYHSGVAYSTQLHELEYRFDWGDGTMSDWASTVDVAHAWTAAGSYGVMSQARCQVHPGVESVWSLPFAVTVRDAETVSTPNPPDGPTAAEIQTALNYDLSGAVSSWGHTVQYRVDYGNGYVDAWSVGDFRNYTWTSPGTYDVMVQARCQDHPDLESAWSAATTVTITEPVETVTGPMMSITPTNGGVDDEIVCRAYNGGSNLFHPIESRFDWGDGSFSTWVTSSGGYFNASHAWSVAGTYQIRAQGRCIAHPDVVSGWSAPDSLVITATESVNAPTVPPGEFTYDVGDIVGTWITGAVSTMGHPVENQMDWGDGTLSTWTRNTQISRVWDVEGDFIVRGHSRCQTHPEVASEWSAGTRLVHVVDLEDVSTPTISGPATGNVDVPVTFTAAGAASSQGHPLEYQIYWSLGTNIGTGLGWTTADNLVHTFTARQTYFMRVRARCIEHQIESSISAYHVITISP